MKFISYFILAALSCDAYASHKEEVFSNYHPNFEIASTDNQYHTTYFEGSIEVSGELVFTLDMLSEDSFVTILAIHLKPDENYLQNFPAVNDGYKPREVLKIELFNIEKISRMVFNKTPEEVARGSQSRFLSVRGKFLIGSYATTIECDNRLYWAHLEKFTKPSEFKIAIFRERSDIVGC